jgi:hypothetical protein
MSGSAKKRREKERRQARRERARDRQSIEMARRNAEAHEMFMSLVGKRSDPVPGFTHEIVFGKHIDQIITDESPS